MNNIEKVSIGGYAFSLDTEAYKIARQYLDELEHFYNGKKSGKEVMEGIEERMAELLLERIETGGIVNIQMVETVIAILGRPAAIEAESVGDEAEEVISVQKYRRRLYRDPQNKFLSGVLSGIATYFNIDVTILRACVCIVGMLGFAVDKWCDLNVIWVVPIIYCIAWICTPEAKTVQQRLEMKGQSGSVDEIQKNVERGEYCRKEVHSDFWQTLGRICKFFIGIVLFILGISGFLTGVFFTIGATFLGTMEWAWNWAGVVPDDTMFINFISPLFVKIILALVYFIPCLGMIYGGINLIFNLKSQRWHPGLILFLLWIVLLFALVVWAFMAVGPTYRIL